jgi:hypothetical protein
MNRILIISSTLLVLTGCNTTFGGTVLVVTVGDIILYVFIALVLALFVGLFSVNRQKAFWSWFILGLLVTPLASLIRLLYILGRRRREQPRK